MLPKAMIYERNRTINSPERYPARAFSFTRRLFSGLFHRSKAVQLSLIILSLCLIAGCATRKEIRQFQLDSAVIQQRQLRIEHQLDRIEAHLDTIHKVLGGNVEESFSIQDAMLRSLRADSRAVSSELSSLVETLGARISDSDVHMRRLVAKLDEVNLLLSRYAALQDTTGEMAKFDINDPEKLYQQSYLDFTNGEIELARMGFNQYIMLYPRTSLADNALYWIGETYMAEGKTDSARMTFERFVRVFPVSKKLPTTLYKLGLIYASTELREQAIESYQRILHSYPDSPEAPQAKARLEELEEAESDTNRIKHRRRR